MATIQQMLKEISARGLSQERIGSKIGLSQSAISRMMRGETQCTHAHWLRLKSLYESYIPPEKRPEQIEIDKLKRALVVAQGNFEESVAHAQDLRNKIDAMKGQRCWLCRVKFFFKGE